MGKTKRSSKQEMSAPRPQHTGENIAWDYERLVSAIADSHLQAQATAVTAVNAVLTARNWIIGRHIFEYEQRGLDRARYGEKLLDELSKDLRRVIGKGFTKRYLEHFRRFYRTYPIAKTVISQFNIEPEDPSPAQRTTLKWQDDDYFVKLFNQLSWSHFIELSRIDDPLRRAFYEVETLKNRWSVRELKRQIASLLYERVGLSRDKQGVLDLAKEGETIATPAELIRDPYVFEFLGLAQEERFTESQLEARLLDNLQSFLLEMGRGFCFVDRQRRVTFDNEHYYIDLLLFNRRLKCLVAVDLTLGPFRHEHAGAMNFYLN